MLYLRFTLSYRDVEELLAERAIRRRQLKRLWARLKQLIGVVHSDLSVGSGAAAQFCGPKIMETEAMATPTAGVPAHVFD